MPGSTPFKRLLITRQPEGGWIVSWQLTTGFKLPGGSSFTLLWARDPNGEWTQATADPDQVTTQITDPDDHVWHTENDLWYKVRVIGPGITADSAPTHVFMGMNTTRYLQWKKMLGSITLATKKGTGGVLRRRKWWGTPCPQCLDFDTGLPTKEYCSTCYSTGFVGGYWPSTDLGILWAPGDRTYEFDELHWDQDIIRKAKIPAVSLIDTEDIWIETSTHRFWRVGEIQDALMADSASIAYTASLYLIKPTDIIYTLP